MKIYCIPGLGFDHRIFSKLDLGSYKTANLDWIEPEKEETFRSYVERLAQPIDDSSPVALIGHSMGGMASQEIAQFKTVSKIFLISSIKSREELPVFFKSVGPTGLYKFFTKDLTLNSFKYWDKFHDYDTPEEQALFRDMVGKNTNHYLQWALKRLSHWQSPEPPAHTHIVHIHGDNDKTFPLRYIKSPRTVIKEGGHFMVYKNHEQISSIIRSHL
ncbi:MAG: alpha/beta hydrolase [Bacteroidota bacterium]